METFKKFIETVYYLVLRVNTIKPKSNVKFVSPTKLVLI